MKRLSGLSGILALGLVVASCGGGDSMAPGGGGGGGGGGNNCPAGTFCMGSSTFFTSAGFAIKTLTVAVNSTVTWTNDSGVGHNVLWTDAAARNAAGAGDGTGDMPDFANGSHTRVFSAPGTYKFYCSIHGTPTSGMTGTLTVQ